MAIEITKNLTQVTISQVGRQGPIGPTGPSGLSIDSGSLTTPGDVTISGSLFVSGTTEFGGDLVPKTARGATLGTSERPFSEIYVSSGSINIASDIPGDPNTTLTNIGGNILVSAGGMRLLGDASFIATTASFEYLSGSFTHIGLQFNEGDIVTTGSLKVSGSTIMFGDNTIVGNTLLSGSIGIVGESTLTGSFLVSGSTTQIGDNTLLGNTLLSGSIGIVGNSTLTGSIDVTDGIKVNGVEYSSSLYQSSSISGSVIQFNKGNNTTQTVTIPKGLGYSGLGWARYDDTTYTTSSAFTIVDGADVRIPCNGSGSIETHMHSSIPFFNPTTQRIQAENDGDTYSITIDFNMKASTTPDDGDDVRLSMNNTVGTPYTRVGRDLHFAKKDTNWHKFHEIFQYYSDTDFVANGNEFNIIPNGVNVQIADVIIFIQRTQNHSQH